MTNVSPGEANFGLKKDWFETKFSIKQAVHRCLRIFEGDPLDQWVPTTATRTTST